MSQFESIIANDRDEHLSAAHFDLTKTRLIGGLPVDEDDVPDEADL